MQSLFNKIQHPFIKISPESGYRYNISQHNKGHLRQTQASQVALVVKDPSANTGDIRDSGSILESGRSLGGGPGTHSSILAWKIQWTKEIGGLQSMRSQRVRLD